MGIDPETMGSWLATRACQTALIRIAGTADGLCFDGVPSLSIDAMLSRRTVSPTAGKNQAIVKLADGYLFERLTHGE